MSTTKSGIDGLDQLLNGGLPVGSTVLVEGLPGTGKTILGMQFIFHGAVEEDESGIFITFEELPDQLYNELQDFGWDLRELEKQNKLRVICLSPEVLIEQIEKPNGLIEQMINEINCKRIVIDSISLYQFGSDDLMKSRKTIYSLRNVLRKYKITSLLISELNSSDQGNVPFVNYLVDGVIRLSLKNHINDFRKRTLEVLKMRGCRIQEGEHIYRISENGIHLVPALSLIEDKALLSNERYSSTGIMKLDQILSGGIPNGTCFLIDTNSKANYKYFLFSIVCNRLVAGENVIMLLSNLMDLFEMRHLLKLFGVSMDEYVKDGKLLFIEHFDRPIPDGYESAVIQVAGTDNREFEKTIKEKLVPIIASSLQKGEKWFIYYNLNTIISQRGKEFLEHYYAEEVSTISSAGITMVTLVNFSEIGSKTASFLERTSHGVIKTWVDGSYQYLQVLKSPQGKISHPLLVENIIMKPFIRLV
ncbi:ATPase domain-containing protein [Bacillus sp. 1NLA3E]|uniref:ATPase domain-containing protein n=1 Tax=Bacillus sp. 1NLA3E TaxID=666686 RepID=UPI000247EA76|nr:ATPase domain-containing protein [Bacillus sp. 1NLA3E]AGK52404.1 circadian clock protein KaiC [Bacillus sp. 1NLA3E]